MSLEDYVAGVVAAEGSMEDQPEALKALAIAARTYSLRNLGRHTREGFDFCTLTHCQRFVSANPNAAGAEGSTNRRALAAVRATAGVVLSDDLGQAADVYFSASCGGATANIQTLWGVTPPAYLRGVRDEYCATMPHHNWTDVIPASQLWQALRSDPRTDPGSRLDNVRVAQIDETGRAQSIAIEGQIRRTVSGWDFKIIVGRSLGWNKLKSSRFEITRAGSDFVFSGSGFGHGLGLCQEGAHVLAQRGASYQQILAKYFPGAIIANEARARAGVGEMGRSGVGETKERWQADVLLSSPSSFRYGFTFRTISPSPLLPYSPSPHLLFTAASAPRLVISSDHFRLNYPANVRRSEAEGILQTLDSGRAGILRRVAAAGLTINAPPLLEIFINETTGDFVGRTGLPSWAAAATKGNHVELQPVSVLQRRGVLWTTLRHELAHVVIDTTSKGHAPRWLSEGLALYLAGEGALLARYSPREQISIAEIDRRLAGARSSEEMRTAYAAAHREVSALVRREGEAAVWRRVAGS
jgi:SpoIID/LytB domain protein